MGVRGLLKYLRTHPRARKRSVSLAGLAENIRQKTGNKASIICDFLSILFWLVKYFHEAKVTDKTYQIHSSIYGGDYVEYGNRFISFIRALRYVCVEPILFVDGARGSILEEFNAKVLTYKARDLGGMKKITKWMRYCQYDAKLNIEDVKSWKKYPLVIIHVLMALRSEGVQIVYCDGEADSEMAIYARTHLAQVCGIMTTDTDMVMMRKCTVIHCKFFDRYNTLGIRNPILNEKPDDIICELITPDSLARALQIRTKDLKILSIICGNDYTCAFQLYLEMELEHPYIESAAKWIKDRPDASQRLLNIPPFKHSSLDPNHFLKAIMHTYKAYGEFVEFKRMVDISLFKTEYHKLMLTCPKSVSIYHDDVKAELKKGNMTTIMSSLASNGVFWRIQFVEGDGTIAHDLTFPLRRVMYKLLGLSKIREYGHFTYSANLISRDLSIRQNRHDLAVLPVIRKSSELKRTLHLVTIVANAQKSIPALSLQQCASIPDAYSPNVATQLKPLVLCASVIYVFSLELPAEMTTFHNIELVTDVFLATSLMSVYGNPPFKVVERPTVDAVNMNTGFACIIQHVYDIASLLGLLHLLPPPGYLYQPAALVACHQVMAADADTIKSKLKINSDFVEIHTIYTFLVQLRRFAVLKDLLREFHQKCSTDQIVMPIDLARLAVAFYHVLGEFHSKVPDLEAHITELQGAIITTQSVSSKGKAKASKKKKKAPSPDKAEVPKKKKKSKSHGAKPFIEDLAKLEADLAQLEALSTQDRAQTGIEQLSIVEPTPEST